MNGPPGSQGVIQSKGKKNKNKNRQSYNPNPQRPTPAEQTGADATPPDVHVGEVAVTSPPAVSCSTPLLRELSGPNIPLVAVSLRGMYARLSGWDAPKGSRNSATLSFESHFDLLPYPRGIINSSNFCFMNSIMQSLIFIPSFAQLAISALAEPVVSPTLCAIGKWMAQYWKSGLTRMSTQPPRLPFAMAGAAAAGKAPHVVDGSSQQDAQEFLQRMLEAIHGELAALEEQIDEELAGSKFSSSTRQGGDLDEAAAASAKGWTVVKGKEKLTVREHTDGDGSRRSLLLAAIFGGTVESHLKGKSRQRDHASVVVEHFYCLPVDIGFAMETSIEEAIERTMTTEKIYDSDRDKELKKTLMLRDLPNVLFLHLRRWAVTAEGELVKLDNTVKIGRSLVLPRSVCSDDKLSNKARTYQLNSVVMHRGAATGKGHYVTYLTSNVANPSNLAVSSGGWPVPYNKQQQHPQKINQMEAAGVGRHAVQGAQVVLCNDAKVTICQAKEMLNETAYFLVYQRT